MTIHSLGTDGGSSAAKTRQSLDPAVTAAGSRNAFFPAAPIQAKLSVNSPGDEYEREADATADKVMRMAEPAAGPTRGNFFKPAPEGQDGIHRKHHEEEDELDKEVLHRKPITPPTIQRKCSACEEEDKQVQKKEDGAETAAPDAGLDQYVSSLGSGGQPLPESTRSYFEPRFGQDFSQVRVHADTAAANSAQSISAHAYTTGNNIVFNQGKYAPDSDSGKQLLAHELTHVVQQNGGGEEMVQRDGILDELEKKAEQIGTAKLNNLAGLPVGPPSGFTAPGCPPNFCQPFADKTGAISDLAWAGPLILAGIARKVNTRVVPLWTKYMTGGTTGVQDISPDFGADFTASPTTNATTLFLIGELKKEVEANGVSLLGGAASASIDFTSRPAISAAINRINDDKGSIPPQMNFNIPKDIPGNLAGGIGKDETAFPIGHNPSGQNDSRDATIKATLTKNASGTITVVPEIKFIVRDTIDLCPGDCGTLAEQVATVPLSRFEATGLTGDVPIVVNFDAPAADLVPFDVTPVAPVVPPPVATPVPGTTTASVLHIRSGPGTSTAIVGGYPRGTAIIALCQTKGTVIEGNDTWYQTDKGFVSGRYVTLTGLGAPPSC